MNETRMPPADASMPVIQAKAGSFRWSRGNWNAMAAGTARNEKTSRTRGVAPPGSDFYFAVFTCDAEMDALRVRRTPWKCALVWSEHQQPSAKRCTEIMQSRPHTQKTRSAPTPAAHQQKRSR